MGTAYIDMIGGVSGDMLIGGLVDCGVRIEELNEQLCKLPVSGLELTAEKVHRGGIEGTFVSVKLSDDAPVNLGWDHFRTYLVNSSLDSNIVTKCREVLETLSKAESITHRVPADEVHLHELGTLDTLVDLVAVISGFQILGIDKIFASSFPLGTGMSSNSHGSMAATSQATGEIFKLTKAPVRTTNNYGNTGELVTPTGAALITSIASFDPITFTPELRGYGCGVRNPVQYPNVTGIWIGKNIDSDDIWGQGSRVVSLHVLETNIDDMSGENFGYAMEKLFDAGALDVWYTPAQMKKNRPGTLLSVLAKSSDVNQLLKIIIRETSTFGVRKYEVTRFEAERENVILQTAAGSVRAKLKLKDGDRISISPEYEDCRKLSIETGYSLMQIMAMVQREGDSIIRGL